MSKRKITSYFESYSSERKCSGRENDSETSSQVNNASLPVSKKCCEKQISIGKLVSENFVWKNITAENLKLKYGRVFSQQVAGDIFRRLEDEVEYFTDDLVKVRIFGKWLNIPRKQVAYGENGLTYTFSGTCLPAIPWEKCNIVSELKEIVESLTNQHYNFVLLNRYKDGDDYMGEHRDDEKDLDEKAPIASFSFGQARDFIFKHMDARGKNATRNVAPVKFELEHGSLLSMEYPTNKFWYHSLPKRKNAPNVRINLTFRKMVAGNGN